MNQYRVISFNLRTQTESDQEQQFRNRVGFLCETLNRLQPDVIGMQEMKPEMRQMMIPYMREYVFLGAGRDQDRLGEAAGIAVRQERFMIERVVSDILSPTPEVPGSTYGGDQSHCPRIFTSCDLMPVAGGRPFRIMNIHTDHIGPIARCLEIKQMLASYEAQQALRPMPTLLTGDFNALPDAEEMRPVMEDPAFRDLSGQLGGTFHDYDRLAVPEKIDYIFASKEWQVLNVFSIHEKKDGLFLSDHDPVIADLSL